MRRRQRAHDNTQRCCMARQSTALSTSSSAYSANTDGGAQLLFARRGFGRWVNHLKCELHNLLRVAIYLLHYRPTCALFARQHGRAKRSISSNPTLNGLKFSGNPIYLIFSVELNGCRKYDFTMLSTIISKITGMVLSSSFKSVLFSRSILSMPHRLGRRRWIYMNETQLLPRDHTTLCHWAGSVKRYGVRLSVRLSFPAWTHSSNPLQRVCCCGPGGQEISIDCSSSGGRMLAVPRYDTIQDAILTCARKPTRVGLMYRTEPTTKNCNKQN